MARRVTAPDGLRWKVARQWAPWSARLRRPDRPDLGGGDGLSVDDAGGLLVVLGVLVALALVFLVTLAAASSPAQ